MTPGRERSMRSLARAVFSEPDSMAARRASICDSTCARSSFREAPTARFNSSVAGFSQLSVICVSTPDLRPSQASRNCFQEDSSCAEAQSLSKRPRRSAKSAESSSGRVMPRWTRGSAVLFSCAVITFEGEYRRAQCNMPFRKKVSRVVKSQDAKIIAGIHRAKFARCRRVPRLRAGKCGGHLFETGQRQLAQPVRSCRDRAQHAAPLQRAGAERLGLLCLGLRRGGGFRCRHEGRECRGVLHGNIREHLAVESDTRGLEAVNQLAVGQAVQAGGGADALNPQAAVLAFLDAAVALGVTIGAIGGFLCGLVELALGEEKAFCPLEVLLAPCTALGAAFYACHGFLLLGGKQNRLRRRKEKHASCNGFVSGMNCLPHFSIALRRLITSAAIGRQAPVKRCLARFAGLASRIFLGGHTRKRPSEKFELTNGEIPTWLMVVGLKRGAAYCAPTWKL